MKKSILLIAACLIAGFVGAQESASSSVLFGGPVFTQPHAQPSQMLSVDEMNRMHQIFVTQRANEQARRAKTTSTTISDWYDLMNQNYNTTGVNVPIIFYWPTFPDSNVYDNTSTTPYYLFTHMMGMSFDPTDSGYYDSTFNSSCLTAAVVPHMALTGQSYTIDSFFGWVNYQRHDNTVTDSLIIEFVTAFYTSHDTGSYNLRFSAQSYFNGYASDDAPRFGTCHYNPGLPSQVAPYNAAPYINDAYFDSITLPSPYKQRVAIALHTGSDADTTNGLLNLGHLLGGAVGQVAIALPAPLTLTSSEHLVTSISFKSGHAGGTYPHGTTIGAANWIKLYAGSPRSTGSGSTAQPISFRQGSSNTSVGYAGSFQEGLNINNQSRYDASVSLFSSTSGIPVHDELIGCSAYASTSGTYYDFLVTSESYHVTWSSTISLGVNNVVNELKNVTVYPNPAKNILNVSYSAPVGTVVTATLTDMIGQVVATETGVNGNAVFNVASLPQGIYIYNLQANGEHSTGRVLIAH